MKILQAPEFCTLLITTYRYHNLDLVIMIAKIVQNDLQTTKSNITFLVTLLGLQLY